MNAQAAPRLRPMTCLEFITQVLGLVLSIAWRVLIQVAMDRVIPSQLTTEQERAVARELFGDVGEVPELAWRKLLFILGRGAGKTTVAAAIAIWRAVTGDISFAGPGDVPVVAVVSIDKSTATLFVRVARELVGRVSGVVVESEHTQGFTLRRADGRLVAFEVFAASRAGGSLRGRTLLMLVVDESWFLRSEDGGFTITDRDVVQAALPRLRGPLILLSTPWPVRCLTADLFAENYGAPKTALVARAGSLTMQPDDADLRAHVEAEMAADPTTAAREFECDVTQSGSGTFFDGAAVDACVDSSLPIEVPPPRPRADGAGQIHYPRLGAAIDVGFRSDSSALAIVEEVERGRFRLLFVDEMRPRAGQPLKPSDVVRQFAGHMARYGATVWGADSFYLESVRELSRQYGISVREAPGGATGKADTYAAMRAAVHEGRFSMPRHPRLVAQFKTIMSTALSGGGLRITAPRRAGSGHSDVLSAVVLAVWMVGKRDPARGFIGPDGWAGL